MKRIILTAALIGALVSAIAPAFASEVTNCSSVPASELARFVIEQSQQEGGQ